MHSAPPSPAYQRRPQYDRQDYFTKPPKHDLPRFSGECPHVWLDMSITYFEMYRVPSDQWIATASLYMEGHAALWLQAFKRWHFLLHWDDFVAAVLEEFGQDEYEGQMNRLMQLKQTGLVMEYRSAFESCMYNLIALDPTLGSKWFVSQFVFGLRDEIRCAVRLQAPSSVTRAASLARIQEEEVEHYRPRQRQTGAFCAAPVGLPLPAPPPAAGRPDPPKQGPGEDYTRERQLRDFRRANGLCFQCGDKYNKEHHRKRQAQLLMINVGAFGELLSDETVAVLDTEDTPTEAACCHISVHAMAGSEAVETVRLRALVGN